MDLRTKTLDPENGHPAPDVWVAPVLLAEIGKPSA
jgi:hypothetical protein